MENRPCSVVLCVCFFTLYSHYICVLTRAVAQTAVLIDGASVIIDLIS